MLGTRVNFGLPQLVLFSGSSNNSIHVLEEVRKHKSTTRSVDLHFKLQKPVSKDDASKKIKKNKKRWWRNALLFFRFPKRPPAGGAAADPGALRLRIGSISGPVYVTESRSGSTTPYRTVSRPGSGPLARGNVEIPYISLRERNMDHNHSVSATSATPKYLVT
ncbi:Unknown protein [Striga hermonthica]|uniref:Uncharacterized protein n=1 Tax=Striga hermonthica TaxID=68872 RepID=A0A9N7MXU9_STRHE|nr:Unknown protein [Striga hermonthica]